MNFCRKHEIYADDGHAVCPACDLLAQLTTAQERIAELERENKHLRQYEDRGDFVIYRNEWERLQRIVEAGDNMADWIAAELPSGEDTPLVAAYREAVGGESNG